MRIPSLAVLFLLLLSLPAPAGVTISTSEDHYIVEGSTRAQILRYYRRREENFAASARPSFKYAYTWRSRGGLCTVADVDVRLHIHYVYPRLANATGRSTGRWWNGILEKLGVHERIHGEIAADAARELERELKTLRDEPCPTLRDKVAARAARVFADHKRSQEDYDRLTEHGLRQERYRGR